AGYLTGPDSDQNWVTSDAKGTREEPLLVTNPAGPTYSTGASDPARCATINSANVRALRVTLRLRSDRPDHSKGANWPGDVMANAENRTGSLNVPGYRLFTAQLNVTLRNMTSTTGFIF